MGFEPTHGDRIGLAVQRLNHSATLSCSDQLCHVFVVIWFGFVLQYKSMGWFLHEIFPPDLFFDSTCVAVTNKCSFLRLVTGSRNSSLWFLYVM